MVCPFASCTTSGREPVGDLEKQQFKFSWIISSLCCPGSPMSSRAEARINSGSWIWAHFPISEWHVLNGWVQSLAEHVLR